MNVVWSIIIFYNLLSPHGNSREELVVLICSFASTQKIDDVSHIFSPPWICCGSQAICLGCRRSALNFRFLHFSLPSCHQLITRITFGEHFWNSQILESFPLDPQVEELRKVREGPLFQTKGELSKLKPRVVKAGGFCRWSWPCGAAMFFFGWMVFGNWITKLAKKWSIPNTEIWCSNTLQL